MDRRRRPSRWRSSDVSSRTRIDSAGPDFLAAVLDHVASDESLLVAVASESGHRPEAIMAARQRLSPELDWSP